MEQHEAATSFESRAKKQKKLKRIRSGIAVLIIVAILLAGAWGVMHYVNANAETAAGTTTYNVNAVSLGEVTVAISGSGTLSAIESETVTAAYDSTVTDILASAGDRVTEGQVVARLESAALDAAIDEALSQLDRISVQIAALDATASASTVKAGAAGTIAAVYCEAGDTVESVMAEHGCLALISADGCMTARLECDAAVYDAVTLDIAGAAADGSVIASDDGVATLLVETDEFEPGAKASVYTADGVLLGETTLELSAPVRVTATTGVISAVYGEAGDTVSRNTSFCKIASGAYSTRYTSLCAERDALADSIAELRELYAVTAPFDGLLADMPLTTGDNAAGTPLATFTGGGFTVSLSVDELDIADLALGQKATVTLDALDGEYEASVTAVSYSGSASSYVTSYPITLTLDDIEGALPGMSASADITIQSSGESLMVPVSAVQTENGESFVYIAPADARMGSSYAETAIDLATLERVAVTTGMSDGSYIAVAGELDEGDLIIVPLLETSSTYSATENSFSGFGGMGGMGGMGGFDMDSAPSDRNRQQSGGGAPSMP